MACDDAVTLQHAATANTCGNNTWNTVDHDRRMGQGSCDTFHTWRLPGMDPPAPTQTLHTHHSTHCTETRTYSLPTSNHVADISIEIFKQDYGAKKHLQHVIYYSWSTIISPGHSISDWIELIMSCGLKQKTLSDCYPTHPHHELPWQHAVFLLNSTKGFN